MKKLVFIGLVLTASLAAQPRQMGQATEIVPLSQSREAVVGLRMAGGQLTLTGGADDLLEGRFSYSDGQPPVVRSEQDGRTAKVRVRGRGQQEVWTVYLNDTIPIGLSVEAKSGSQKLLLGGINLDDLEVSMERGNSQIELKGSFPNLKEVVVKQSAGPLQLEMPGSYAMLEELEVKGRKGPMSLDLNGTFPELEELTIKSKSGAVVALLTGRVERLQEVKVSAHSAPIALDVRGEWKEDCKIRVEATSGDVRLELPDSVGVIVHPSTASGALSSRGLEAPPEPEEAEEPQRRVYRGSRVERQDGALVNSAYGKSRVTLTVYVETTTGNIHLVGPAKSDS